MVRDARECLINLRIACFSHFSILRKKRKVKTGIFVRFRIPLSLSFSLALLGTHVSRLPSLPHSLFVAPACFSPFFCKREWDKLVNLYANGFDLTGGVSAMSAARFSGGSRSDRGESPKISRSGFSAVYRPPKSNLHDRHSPGRCATSVFNYRLRCSQHLVSYRCVGIADGISDTSTTVDSYRARWKRLFSAIEISVGFPRESPENSARLSQRRAAVSSASSLDTPKQKSDRETENAAWRTVPVKSHRTPHARINGNTWLR